MEEKNHYEVIIIGGSYAGLSAAMTLGRSLRKVLIIDSGKPCNRQTPHSHNFITHDGEIPASISDKAKDQVMKYETIKFHSGLATEGLKTEKGFEFRTAKGEVFTSKKLLFATGLFDVMPAIKGFAECWGISALHCPYCHGYEVKDQTIGLIGNGDFGFELSRLINHWTKKLTLFTNGKSTLTEEQVQKIKSHNIEIVETEISAFEHTNGNIQNIVFANNSKRQVSAVFSKAAFKQHCEIPQQLGCEMTEHGLIKIDDFNKTTIPGVYAAGDNTYLFRTVSLAVGAGTKAAAFINKELIDEAF